MNEAFKSQRQNSKEVLIQKKNSKEVKTKDSLILYCFLKPNPTSQSIIISNLISLDQSNKMQSGKNCIISNWLLVQLIYLMVILTD